VTFYKRFNSNEIFYNRTRKSCPFNTGEDSPVEIIFEEIEAQVISSTISFVTKESTDI
jgi:hypothetical protein